MSTWKIELQSWEHRAGVPEDDAELIQRAADALSLAYAPYSRFHVAAAVRLGDGRILVGTNQENASYPVGICAERVVLSTASSVAPEVPVLAMAVVYVPAGQVSKKPLPPCGMCRQALHEQRCRQGKPFALLMAGIEGPVWKAEDASELLPFAFSGDELP